MDALTDTTDRRPSIRPCVHLLDGVYDIMKNIHEEEHPQHISITAALCMLNQYAKRVSIEIQRPVTNSYILCAADAIRKATHNIFLMCRDFFLHLTARKDTIPVR